MSSRGGYVLKFISGKYQGGEFPLEMDSEIVIGRSSDLDMVLVEDMVSRRHARITSYNGEIGIEDFNSTNGTFVNGERVNKARLKEGDRILVGTNIIKLVHRDTLDRERERDVSLPPGSPQLGGHNPSAMQATNPNANTLPPPRGQGTVRGGPTVMGTISGLIDEVPLPDLLQLFSTSKKSGVLIIHADDTGKVFLREGRVYFATINDDPTIDPYKVFYRLMGWKSGHFSLEHPTGESFQNEMNESVEGLMMEGMRILDEVHALGDDVPDTQSHLIIPKPLNPDLSILKPEQLAVFQLAFNHGRTSQVLNKSEISDVETMQHLLYLIRNSYLRVG